ncbi:MAG: hypothetical protein ACT4QE_15995 [Anaerolineales bacterium]
MPAHEMQLERTYPSGVEEWWCPMCGRRFVAQWAPDTRRLVLEPGEAYIPHRGGGLSLSAAIEPGTGEHTPPLTDAEANSPWAEWLNDLDLDPDRDPPDAEHPTPDTE